jgi:type 2 lantibiotic biosynthesis protein LanM
MQALSELVRRATLPHEGAPPWVPLLERALHLLQEDTPAGAIPFEELLQPFVRAATEQLVQQDLSLLHPRALAQWQGHLLQQLLGFSIRTWWAEFKAFRALQGSWSGAAPRPGEDRLYRAFVQRLRESAGLEVFGRQPMLARFLALRAHHWQAEVGEVLARFAQDRAQMPERLGVGSAQAVLAEVDAGLSDLHHDCRSVLKLTLSTGEALVYKPRSAGLDQRYNDLLVWLERRGAPVQLRAIRVLDRGDYGWIEHVPHLPCEDHEGTRRFYQRAGALLCLVHVLGGRDFHEQNVIACGEHPVLVDVEAILSHPLPGELPWNPPGAGEARTLHDSVFGTGLLPLCELGEDGASFDNGALSPLPPAPMRTWRCQSPNQDAMQVTFEPEPGPLPRSRAMCEGHAVYSPAFSAQVCEGFEAMGRFLMSHREALAAPLQVLAQEPVRAVLRPTMFYDLLLMGSLHSKHLADAQSWLTFVDILRRDFREGRQPEHLLPMVQLELHALSQLSIPRFVARASGTALDLPEPIEACFSTSAEQVARERLARLDESELATQTGLIRAAFSWCPPEGTQPMSLPLRDEALRLARRLAERAIPLREGSAWLSLELQPQVSRYSLRPAGASLQGVAGAALFLGTVAARTGDELVQEAARRALTALRGELGAPARAHALAERIGLGGASGLASLVYAGVRLRSEEGLALAEQAAQQITPGRISRDTELDIVSGCAGALLGLVALHEVCPSPLWRDRVQQCVERLLSAQTPTGAWPSRLTGFSHGAAGMAYALVRAHELLSDDRALQAARAAFAYERSTWTPQGWPDLRQPQSPRPATAWCHGSAGIGLARLYSLGSLDGPEERLDLERALEATPRAPSGLDHLCCGNLGRVELLLSAGLLLSRPSLVEQARAMAAAVVQRAGEQGGYLMIRGTPWADASPGLFQGISGVGLQLLRLEDPDAVPCALAWR